jgi:hypothetical protein
MQCHVDKCSVKYLVQSVSRLEHWYYIEHILDMMGVFILFTH